MATATGTVTGMSVMDSSRLPNWFSAEITVDQEGAMVAISPLAQRHCNINHVSICRQEGATVNCTFHEHGANTSKPRANASSRCKWSILQRRRVCCSRPRVIETTCEAVGQRAVSCVTGLYVGNGRPTQWPCGIFPFFVLPTVLSFPLFLFLILLTLDVECRSPRGVLKGSPLI